MYIKINKLHANSLDTSSRDTYARIYIRQDIHMLTDTYAGRFTCQEIHMLGDTYSGNKYARVKRVRYL
jgi:hypothetical protein